MSSLRSSKRKSLYFKLIALITTMIIVSVLVISAITTIIYHNNILENAEIYNRALINRQQKLMDKELSNFSRIALGIIMAQSYMYNFNTKNSDLTIKSLIDLTYYLQEQKNINEYIESIYLYYSEPNRVITTYDTMRSSLIGSFFDTSWMDSFTADNKSDSYWLANRIKGSKEGDAKNSPDPSIKYLTFVWEIPLFGKTNGAVVINIKQDKFFLDYMGNYTHKMGNMLVIDEAGNLIYSESDSLSQAVLGHEDLDLKSDRTFYVDIGGEETILTCIASKTSNWKYVNVIPKSSLMQSTSLITRIILGICLFYIGVALFVSMLLSRRIYKPLNVVVQYLKNHGNPSIDSGDEASLIRSVFDSVHENNLQLLIEKNQMRKVLEDNAVLMKEKYLNDLIRGKISDSESAGEYLEIFNFQANLNNYVIFTLLIENLNDILSRHDKMEFNLLKYSILADISDLIDGESFLNDDDKIVIIQNTKPMNEMQLLELARQLQKAIVTKTGFTVTVGISTGYTGLSDLEQAYNESVKALNQKIYYGKGEILTYRSISQDTAAQFHYPYELEKKLINIINQGNKEEANRIIEDIFEEIIEKKLINTNIQQIFFRLSGEITKSIAQTGENLHDIFGSTFNILETMSLAQTLKEMEEVVKKLCSGIIGHYERKRSRINIDVIEHAVKFIEENYYNNISIDSVSEHVNFSTSYLSRIFREVTGKTLNEYIVDIKMSKTIELLKSTEYSVEEICHKVGYTNISYFNKLFKARTGTTPGNFRKELILRSEVQTR